MLILGWICSLFAVLAILFLIHSAMTLARTEKRHEEEGEAMVGWIVQANIALYQPGRMSLPAQILVAFDEPEFPDPQLSVLALTVANQKDEEARTRDEKEVAALVRDERTKPYERFRLPDSFTRGREIYSMHVVVERKLLPNRVLQLPFVRCSVIRDDPKARVFMREYRKSDLADFEHDT